MNVRKTSTGTKEIYSAYGYQITEDTHFFDDWYGVTSSLHKRMERLSEQIHGGSRATIDELQQLVKVYPKVPQLKNFLVVAYASKGNNQKVTEINARILAEHPNYLFGKINEVHRHIDCGEIETVQEVVGDHWDLKQLYPDREIFQLSEILSFHGTAVRYFAKCGNLEQGEYHFDIVSGLDSDGRRTAEVDTFLWPLRIERAGGRLAKQREKQVDVNVTNAPPNPPEENAPVFHHAEIALLYERGVDISPQKLEEILALPRESLVQDLVAVLADAVNRFYTFYENGWDKDTCNFAYHALWLLKELEAEEALPGVLTFFEYDREFMDFWVGDSITEDMWQCVYTLSKNQPERLRNFLVKPGVHANAKCTVSEALAQIGLHQSAQREAIIALYADIFETFRVAERSANLLDTIAITYLVADAVDAGYNELLPAIEALHHLDYVDESMHGSFDQLAGYMERYTLEPRKKPLHSVFEHYHWLMGLYDNDTPEPRSTTGDFPSPSLFEPQVPAASQKVGRNDPCPCGSGKKYKKCCG